MEIRKETKLYRVIVCLWESNKFSNTKLSIRIENIQYDTFVPLRLINVTLNSAQNAITMFSNYSEKTKVAKSVSGNLIH